MFKKYLLLTVLTGTVFSAHTQNVGIGTPTPAEKLDVNGNINVSGTIKANGVDGQPNQVLMKSGGGNLVWGDLADYKNFATFLSTGTWTVPAGITKVAIELWGGGGGAASAGGGGGGGYILGVFTVTPAAIINFTVGVGGAGTANSVSSGSSGTISKVTIGGFEIDAQGGAGGAYNNAGSYYASGEGGGFYADPGFTAFLGKNGQRGTVSKKNYAQAGTSTFYEIGEMGNGGDGANSENTGAKGVYYISAPGVFPASSDIRLTGSNLSRVPGGGGSSYLVNSSPGAAGMVVIHY